jgi:DNA-binding HxlR family transcriptional regulator
MKRYGQYCPVAKAAEILAERWTLLVIRELLWGNDRFNAIARGVPRMSPSLLSSRLRQLQRAGIVTRQVGEDGEKRYRLSQAGQELRPIVEQLGGWGQRWLHQLRQDDLDPSLLLLDISREVDPGRLPQRAATVHLRFVDAPAQHREWWLVLSRTGVDVCGTDPGFPVTVWVEADVQTLTRVWLGDLGWADALDADALAITGDVVACRALPHWLGVSRFAAVERATPLPR